jgi:hypothetical protein
MTLIASLLLNDRVQAAGIKWKFDKVTHGTRGKESHEKIIYSVCSEFSVIEYEREIIYIDYVSYVLYRYNKVDGVCLKFPLQPSHTQTPITAGGSSKERTRFLVSSMKLFTSTDCTKINDQSSTLKNILFGADLAKSKMVAPLVVNQFNQNFSESIVSYCVSDTIVGLDRLYEIAKKRDEVFQNNPLLRQIDIVGLIEVLNGFPVQINQRVGNLTMVTTLQGDLEPLDKLKQLPHPDSCRK